jgi:D-tyrosyl-tRNA(Tyr) deacylase
MRVVVQRVNQASVSVKQAEVAEIRKGLLIYVGIERGDTEKEVNFMAEKVLNLRIFPDAEGKMGLNIQDIRGSILSISQFTLASRIKKGRRPDFNNAEEPGKAKQLYELFNQELSKVVKVEKGIFAAYMHIQSVNDGPVTFIIEKNFF